MQTGFGLELFYLPTPGEPSCELSKKKKKRFAAGRRRKRRSPTVESRGPQGDVVAVFAGEGDNHARYY